MTGGNATTPDYGEALAYVHSLQGRGSHLGLDRMHRLLARLGDPQRGLRTIHVGGTNGKGSVCVMMASVLSAAGYRTGLYVKPCWDFADQMRVDGRPIDPAEAAHLILNVMRPAAEAVAAGGTQEALVTEFEFVTAMAILYARRQNVDIFICEVGLGGRLDATNVFDRPLAAVITSIGLDHTDRLGATLTQIAAEKAGIIKRSAPVISAPQEPEALAALEAAARRRECPFNLAGRDGRVSFESASLRGQRISFEGPGFGRRTGPGPRDTDGPVRLEGLDLPLLGPHQLDNAATALTALGVLRERDLAPALDERAVRSGLAATVWPARFEIFGLPEAASRPLIIVDGAHNPPGAKALAATLRQLVPDRRLLLVLGILGDKDTEAYLRLVLPPALPRVAGVFTCRPNSPRAMDGRDLAGRVGAVAPGLPVEPAPGTGAVDDALRAAWATAGPGDVVCVAGSLYQVGLARATAAALVRQDSAR